jgi:hypothetical protein
LSSVAGIAVGQGVGLNLPAPGAVAGGTLVTAVNTGTLTMTLSSPTTSVIAPGTKLYFGTGVQSGSVLEAQRLSYNTYLRAYWQTIGCSGLIDIDGVLSDQVHAGKWRTDFGQASVDGVHPSAALHQAAVNAGIITPAMLSIP